MDSDSQRFRTHSPHILRAIRQYRAELAAYTLRQWNLARIEAERKDQLRRQRRAQLLASSAPPTPTQQKPSTSRTQTQPQTSIPMNTEGPLMMVSRRRSERPVNPATAAWRASTSANSSGHREHHQALAAGPVSNARSPQQSATRSTFVHEPPPHSSLTVTTPTAKRPPKRSPTAPTPQVSSHEHGDLIDRLATTRLDGLRGSLAYTKRPSSEGSKHRTSGRALQAQDMRMTSICPSTSSTSASSAAYSDSSAAQSDAQSDSSSQCSSTSRTRQVVSPRSPDQQSKKKAEKPVEQGAMSYTSPGLKFAGQQMPY